jgi:hypothetical protein
MEGVIDFDALDDEEFVFEPTPEDLAMAIGLVPDPEADRAPLDELADAMVVWAEGPAVERLTSAAVEAIWSTELQESVTDGLRRVARQGDDWAPAAERALAELECGPTKAAVTRAVVERLAMDLGSIDVPLFICLCCVDEGVRAAAAGDRRGLALQCAPVARRNAALTEAELEGVVSAAGLGSVVDRLGTTARRQAVRARLGRLGRLGQESVPALARELLGIAAEDLPDLARDDDVWLAVATALLADRARPELN